MATLYMLMGLPGAGKTTIGKRLEQECPALLLSPDIWMARVVRDGYDADRRRAVQQLQLELADRVLRLGHDVVLEFGFLRRVERDVARTLASNAGAGTQLIFLDPPFEELVRRVKARNQDLPPDTFSVTREHLELCATWLERPLTEEKAVIHH
ncbi:AAA family ATPase [Rhizobium sp. BR 362]|uniref:AAA family ATPase n=1 Tax=Rhizobium sp. BR 362 TaxID=3040670 RepID=UPI003FA6EA21